MFPVSISQISPFLVSYETQMFLCFPTFEMQCVTYKTLELGIVCLLSLCSSCGPAVGSQGGQWHNPARVSRVRGAEEWKGEFVWTSTDCIPGLIKSHKRKKLHIIGIYDFECGSLGVKAWMRFEGLTGEVSNTGLLWWKRTDSFESMFDLWHWKWPKTVIFIYYRWSEHQWIANRLMGTEGSPK